MSEITKFDPHNPIIISGPENTNKPSCGGQDYCRCECHYCGCWEDWDDERKADWDETTGYDRNKLEDKDEVV